MLLIIPMANDFFPTPARGARQTVDDCIVAICNGLVPPVTDTQVISVCGDIFEAKLDSHAIRKDLASSRAD